MKSTNALLVRRKYNVGHRVSEQWVFSGYDVEEKVGFMVPVDRRDAATLLPIILFQCQHKILDTSGVWKQVVTNSAASPEHPTIANQCDQMNLQIFFRPDILKLLKSVSMVNVCSRAHAQLVCTRTRTPSHASSFISICCLRAKIKKIMEPMLPKLLKFEEEGESTSRRHRRVSDFSTSMIFNARH